MSSESNDVGCLSSSGTIIITVGDFVFPFSRCRLIIWNRQTFSKHQLGTQLTYTDNRGNKEQLLRRKAICHTTQFTTFNETRIYYMQCKWRLEQVPRGSQCILTVYPSTPFTPYDDTWIYYIHWKSEQLLRGAYRLSLSCYSNYYIHCAPNCTHTMTTGFTSYCAQLNLIRAMMTRTASSRRANCAHRPCVLLLNLLDTITVELYYIQ